jgi:glycosyltransferase involved in cell wall biosynthesis
MAATDKSTVLLISPHSKVRLSEPVSYGFERRISFLGKIISDRYNTIIIEPDEVNTAHEAKKNFFTFKSFSSIKVRNLRLGSLFLGFNPFFIGKLVTVFNNYNPDVVIVSFPFGIPMASYIVKTVLNRNAALIYNSHNVETEYAKIIGKDSNIPWIFRFFYRKYIFMVEKLAVKLSDFIIAVSEENRTYFLEKYLCKKDKIKVINSGANIPETIVKSDIIVKKDDDELMAVFHGTYKSTHNRMAIDIINTYLASKLRHYPSLKFVVAGNGVPVSEKENVISVGFVDNLYGLLSSCDIAIVPLEEGEGTKLKLFDYMAVGLPIVTTKKGAEGMMLVDGENALITDNVDEYFIKAIETLVNDPIMRKDLGDKGKKLIEEEFHPDVIKKKMYDFLDLIIVQTDIEM